MGHSVQQLLVGAEVKEVHDAIERRTATDVRRLDDVTLAMAKVKTGACIGKAIEGSPLKTFGHEGLVSAVISGEKVPGYLARIYHNAWTRRRLALALLEDDPDVTVTTTITVPMSKVG